MKSAPSNLSNLINFVKKWKCLNLGPKMPYLGIFGLEFQKAIVIFEISTLKSVKTEFLTHTVNFGIGSAFAKSPGSAFSECSGPGPGLLYIVCLIKHVCVNLMKLISCCILDSSDLFL